MESAESKCLKTCPKCGETKVAAESFHRSKSRRDGFDAYCKSCHARRYAERKAADPERLRERGRRSSARWAERNPEKVAETSKRRRELAKARTREARANQLLEAVCMDCGETKPRSAFASHSRRRDGLHKRCDVCRKDRRNRTAKAHRERNRDSIGERLSARRKTARHKEWERRHRQKPHVRETARLRDQIRNGRMREFQADGKISRREWLAIRAAFGDCCCYCDKPGRMTLEHLTPLACGGRNEIGNVAPSCSKCNSSKRGLTAEEFAPIRAAEIRQKAAIYGGEVTKSQPLLFDWSPNIGRRTEGGGDQIRRKADA